jgi:hypothetical protein
MINFRSADFFFVSVSFLSFVSSYLPILASIFKISRIWRTVYTPVARPVGDGQRALGEAVHI